MALTSWVARSLIDQTVELSNVEREYQTLTCTYSRNQAAAFGLDSILSDLITHAESSFVTTFVTGIESVSQESDIQQPNQEILGRFCSSGRMHSSLFEGKIGVLLGVGLFITGIGGGIILQNPLSPFLALFGVIIALFSVVIFGLLIPLVG